MSEPSGVAIAVVIPTWRRGTRLAFALEALAAQTLPHERFEVVVARAPGEPDPVDGGAPPGLSLHVVEAERRGPSAQRNAGWRATAAPVVAFTDDDCRPDPEWLERLLVACRENDGFVLGRTEPDPDELHLLHGFARSMEVSGPNPWYPSCNIAYPRALLEQVGGFDEVFEQAWGEDTDLALRSIAAGARPSFAGDARVWHAVHPRTVAEALRDAARRDSIPLVLARHPAQRRELYWRIFLRKRHARIVIALAGALTLRRRPALALIAVAPWVAGALDRRQLGLRGLARQALHLPGRACLDLVETLTTIRGAIRHRVPVL